MESNAVPYSAEITIDQCTTEVFSDDYLKVLSDPDQIHRLCDVTVGTTVLQEYPGNHFVMFGRGSTGKMYPQCIFDQKGGELIPHPYGIFSYFSRSSELDESVRKFGLTVRSPTMFYEEYKAFFRQLALQKMFFEDLE